MTEWMDLCADAAVLYNEIVLSLADDCFGIKLTSELELFHWLLYGLQNLWIMGSIAELLNFDETIRMQLTSFALMKTTQLFLNITDWIWAYDEFALLMKNATTRLKMLAYSLFALNDTLDHIFTFFNY